jgi:ATP-dependent Clp protease protease subunit
MSKADKKRIKLVEEIERLESEMKKNLTQIYVDHNSAGKTFDQLSADMERDNYMSADQAVAYGLADKVISKRA